MTSPSKMRWQLRRRVAEETREQLLERFPRCFRPKGATKTPLKVDIFKDIRAAAPDIPRRRLQLALKDYTSGRTYLRAIVAGAYRVDLDGFPAGEVNDQDAAIARARLEKSEKYPARIGYRRRAAHGGVHA